MSEVSRSEPLVVTTNSWRRLGDHKPPARSLCLVARHPSLPRGVAVDVQALRWNQNADSWYQGAVDPVPAHEDDLWALAPMPDLAIWDRATSPPAAKTAAAPPAAPNGVKASDLELEWSDLSPPNDECPYDHATAASPLGEYSVQYPDPLLFLNGRHIGTHADMEAAKNAAQEHLRRNALDLCRAHGQDKRDLRIDCFYAVDEMVPEALDLAKVEGERGYFLRICKACRGALLDHLGEWRYERVALRRQLKDHDGHLLEDRAEGLVPVLRNGRIIYINEEEWHAERARKGHENE